MGVGRWETGVKPPVSMKAGPNIKSCNYCRQTGVNCTMKRLYLLLLFCIPTSSFSQPYFNDGATWYYDLWPGDTVSYVKIEKTAEVLTAGKLCDELTFSYYNFAQSSTPSTQHYYTYVSGDTVMIYNSGNSRFGPLYNFSDQPGDTISCWVCSSSFVIDSTPVVTINNTILKTQHIRMYATQYTFITFEKIGNTGFLIPHMQMANPSQPGLNLRCYQDNTGLYLHTGVSESCDDGNELHDTTSIQIMSGQFGVAVVSNSIVPGSEISIYNIRGQLVVREIAEQTTTCYVEMQFDSRAVYFATVRNGEEYFSEKFVLLNCE